MKLLLLQKYFASTYVVPAIKPKWYTRKGLSLLHVCAQRRTTYVLTFADVKFATQ